MNRNILAGMGVGLLAGFLLGYFVGSRPAAAPMPLPTAAAPAAQMPNPGAFELQQHLFAAQQAVERDPKNLRAWIALGDGFFESHQPAKAIDAYQKALELDPKNPNVLTDQGIMYREMQAFDKAIANFEKANKLDPNHMQSLYNLGIVYAHDKKAPEKAIQYWNRVIKSAPTSPQAELSRKAIEELKTSPRQP